MDGTRIAGVDDVPEVGSYLFTAEDAFTNEWEVILVRCEEDPGVEAWVNNCTHEDQRLDRGSGAAMRDGQIICPRHGSMFDACSGACDNGEAAGTTLPDVDIAVEGGSVYLVDDNYTYLHEGGIGGGDGPSSSSHIGF
ncbi:rieske [2Fe-2S] domain containing oxidoreductase [Halogeometricum pallidum JCM 14848]|uniref:Rieske [2Fe-2S] domain containing oxidoreductase n=1 Tax=Halogeometricum pallidum JCM 14848 TaxID=1227487 RepID=M0D309_HALPD|nr:Rieske 2Fe-2S domain-containing protein [Halogeometricum pallidum]ELZ28509.1 rieske [2Fe-2S] domain containing oxidoreductase [Halogeometricum pallidum JCM 14848]